MSTDVPVDTIKPSKNWPDIETECLWSLKQTPLEFDQPERQVPYPRNITAWASSPSSSPPPPKMIDITPQIIISEVHTAISCHSNRYELLVDDVGLAIPCVCVAASFREQSIYLEIHCW